MFDRLIAERLENMKTKWVSFLCGCIVLSAMVAHAQKVIVEGDGSLLKSQMELYAQDIDEPQLKAKYLSYGDPKEWKTFSPAQFKEIYNKQLKDMYRIVDGKIVQFKAWKLAGSNLTINGKKIYREPSMEVIENAIKQVPQLCRVQIQAAFEQGFYEAKVSNDNIFPSVAAVKFDEGMGPYEVGTVLEAYLLQVTFSNEERRLFKNKYFFKHYKCVPDSIATRVRPPTMKEMVTAVKQNGLKPLVLVPNGTTECKACDGTGIDQEKIDAAEAAAKQESQSLGKREKMYDAFGNRTAKKHRTLGDSKSFTAARLKRNKPKCQTCGGDGKAPCEIFRTLAK